MSGRELIYFGLSAADHLERRSDLVKFLCVADAGKIHGAAVKLIVSQPALSQVIAKLGVCPPAREIGLGTDFQDRMDQEMNLPDRA